MLVLEMHMNNLNSYIVLWTDYIVYYLLKICVSYIVSVYPNYIADNRTIINLYIPIYEILIDVSIFWSFH